MKYIIMQKHEHMSPPREKPTMGRSACYLFSRLYDKINWLA